MLKFFRRIRQNLFSENQFSKYLVYSTGEILLVMIGILLALQVNNWNEQRKVKSEETKILKNLITSLNQDMASLDFHIQGFEISKNSMITIINHIENDFTYHDSLKFHFGNTTVTWSTLLNTEVYAVLLASKINTISNEDLKREIEAYYRQCVHSDNLFSRYVVSMENAIKNVFSTRFLSYWDGNYVEMREIFFTSDEWWNPTDFKIEMIPRDFEALKEDKEYMYHLKGLKNEQFWLVEGPLFSAKVIAQKLIETIEQELN